MMLCAVSTVTVPERVIVVVSASGEICPYSSQFRPDLLGTTER